MVVDGRPILQNSQCVALLVSFEFWSQVLGFETYCIEGNESKTRKTKSWCLQNEEPWNYWNSTGFPTQSSIFCEGMEGAKQGGHMVILVVPGRNLSEELTLNLEFSPIVPWQQIQDPSASGWKLHMLWTNLIGQEIWQRKTDSKCSCHIFKYICIQYIMYSIYIYKYIHMCLSVCFCKFNGYWLPGVQYFVAIFANMFLTLEGGWVQWRVSQELLRPGRGGGRCFGNICGWTACFYMSNISMITPPIHAFIWTSENFCNNWYIDIPKCIFVHWYQYNSTYMWFQTCDVPWVFTLRVVFLSMFFPPCGKPIFGE